MSYISFSHRRLDKYLEDPRVAAILLFSRIAGVGPVLMSHKTHKTHIHTYTPYSCVLVNFHTRVFAVAVADLRCH